MCPNLCATPSGAETAALDVTEITFRRAVLGRADVSRELLVVKDAGREDRAVAVVAGATTGDGVDDAAAAPGITEALLAHAHVGVAEGARDDGLADAVATGLIAVAHVAIGAAVCVVAVHAAATGDAGVVRAVVAIVTGGEGDDLAAAVAAALLAVADVTVIAASRQV